jgi:putative transposase
MRERYTLRLLCKVLEVSRSGYNKWLNRRDSAQKQRRMNLTKRVREIFEDSKGRYGAPRVYMQLKQESVRCTRRTVEELMRKMGLRARRKRKFKSTTDSKHDLPIAPNLLNQNFNVARQNDVWTSDITYIETQEDWLYLAVFIDLNSRAVVGSAMSDTMTADLVQAAFEAGLVRTGIAPRIVHSDRGSQFASEQFRAVLKQNGCIQSMSRKGNCWDNAPTESFFGTLKSELVYHHNYKTRKEAELSIFEYVEIFYNRKRLHSTLGYLSPLQFALKGKKAA